MRKGREMKVEMWREGYRGIMNCSEWMMESANLLGRRDPRIAPAVVKMPFSPFYTAAVTDRLIYMDLIIDEDKVNGAIWKHRHIYTCRSWYVCTGHKTHEYTKSQTRSARAVCLLCSYFPPDLFKSAAKEEMRTTGPAEDCRGKNTHDPFTSTIFIIHFKTSSFVNEQQQIMKRHKWGHGPECHWNVQDMYLLMKLYIYEMLVSKVTYSNSYWHSYTDGGGCPARCRPATSGAV